jgi:hypothetical protein
MVEAAAMDSPMRGFLNALEGILRTLRSMRASGFPWSWIAEPAGVLIKYFTAVKINH